MRWKSNLAGAILAGFCALAQFRLIIMVFQADYGRCVQAAQGVVIGRPHWRIFQSRVLGPYIIQALSYFFTDYAAAHIVFSIAALAVAGFLAWRLGERLGQGEFGTALLAFVIFQAAFALLLSKPWLYAWDYIDAIVFLLFIDFVVAGKRLPWFVGLFVAAILNRESGQFIALWMIVDPLSRWAWGRLGKSQAAPLERAKLIAGLSCLAAGFAIVETLRRMLLVEEIGPKIFANAAAASAVASGTSFHPLAISENLNKIRLAMTASDHGASLVAVSFVLLFQVGVGWIALRLMYQYPVRLTGLSLVYLVILCSVAAFSRLLETRSYVVLIPLLVAGTILLSVPKAAHCLDAAASGPGRD